MSTQAPADVDSYDVDSYDVVVVGAGVSGLAAAESLIAAGLDVLVIESRDRVGGRLHSFDVGERRLDLGATWYWPGEHRVSAIVERFDLDVHAQHLDGDAIYHDPKGSRRVEGNPLDVPSFRFSSGADSIPRALADEIGPERIVLSSPVTAVRSNTGWLEVASATSVTQARHVVMSLPPALAVSAIDFGGHLEERLHGFAALTPVWMGSTTKVVAHYASAFWRDKGLSGSGISHFGPLREVHDMSGPNGEPAALFGFAQASDANPAAVDEQAVVEQLVSMFGPEANSPLSITRFDWRAERATSPPGVEHLNAYQTYGHEFFQRPALHGRLHWSSTETSNVNPGHIEGALAAADRAVHNILSHRGAQQ